MGKKRKAPGERGCHSRPENAASAPELYAQDHERYHSQNAALQLDMASLATTLLGLQAPRAAGLVADLGCGSGLSAAALGRHAGVGGWVGTDITPEMVQLAAASSSGAGGVAVSDFGQGLPLRAACLDGAISVSAVQWLCSAADPPASIRRFFSGLHRSLRPRARAALQIYPEGDSQAQQLVKGAQACGLDAGFFVAFPHSSPAKKCYLLAQRPQRAQQAPQGVAEAARPAAGAHLSARCCNLAWPKTGSCVLGWLWHLPPQHSPEGLAGLASVAQRMQQEHASMGKRMVRLLRRAVSLTEADGTSGGNGSGDGAAGATGSGEEAQQRAACRRAVDASGSGSSSGSEDSSPVVHAELEAQHEGLMPCGGAIFVQLTAAAEVLGAAGGVAAAGQHQAAAAEPEEPATVLPGSCLETGAATAAQPAAGQAGFEPQRYAAAVEAAAQRLLESATAAGSDGGADGGTSRPSQAAAFYVRHTLLKPASPEDAARQQSGQLFRAPPADGGSGAVAKALRFMQLEPLEELQQAGLAAAVLHAHKMAQHLALRLSCSSGLAGSGCSRCAGGSDRSSGSTLMCCACCARCLAALCGELNGCVVGLDGHLLPGKADATWVLFLPGLQQLGRDELEAAVLRHFAPVT
ncbi:hypothetical protein ABPG75_005224 [Micractinium tetrahymenae]